LAKEDGSGDALTTSAHASLAALRAPARSPFAALLQISSTFAFELGASFDARTTADLHTATAACTPSALPTPLGVVGVLDVVGLVAALAGAAVEVVWLLEVELLELLPELLELLPQPAIDALAASATVSHMDSFRFIVRLPFVPGS
jgi:hypothetical protein